MQPLLQCCTHFYQNMTAEIRIKRGEMKVVSKFIQCVDIACTQWCSCGGKKSSYMWSKECGKREKQTVATIELDAMH